MKKLNINKLKVAAYVSLAVAILSAFTTIVGYTNYAGEHKTFTLFDFLGQNGNVFDLFVSYEYIGTIYWDVDIGIIRVFAILAIIAIICAIAGVSMISRQKENRGSVILAIIGFIGTLAPSILILVCVIIFRNDYLGSISCGIYPIVSPIAMIICIIATTQMHRRNLEYKRKMKAVEGYLHKGGDL